MKQLLILIVGVLVLSSSALAGPGDAGVAVKAAEKALDQTQAIPAQASQPRLLQVSTAELDELPSNNNFTDREMEDRWQNCMDNTECHAAYEDGDVDQVDINQAQPQQRAVSGGGR